MPAEPAEEAVSSPEQLTAESGRIWSAGDHSFLLQAIMENQRTLGEVKNAVESLQSTVGTHGTKIDRISHIVYAAGAVLVILSGIGAFVLDKIWDQLVTVLAASGAS